MKNILSSIIITTFLLSSCVKDPEAEVNADGLVEVKVDGNTNFTLLANPSNLYTITFRVISNNGEINNGEDVKFSVSKGKLIDPDNLSTESGSVTIKIKNKVATVFYRADSDAADDIQLVMNVDPFVVIKKITTNPVLPTGVVFEHPQYSVNNAAPLDLVAFLLADSAKASSNLEINLSYQTWGVNNAIINLTPSNVQSVQLANEPYTKVTSRVENVSQQRDTVMVIARYNNIPMDTTLIYFHD